MVYLKNGLRLFHLQVLHRSGCLGTVVFKECLVVVGVHHLLVIHGLVVVCYKDLL